MLRLSANLGFLWPDRPLLQRIDAAGRAGFKAVEFHWPYDEPTAAVRDACANWDMRILGVNTVRGNVAAGEAGLGALPGRKADFAAAFDQALAFCVDAGATAIHCMAGTVQEGEHAAARATFIDNLRRAADKAALHGVTLLLEPLNTVDAPGYFYSTAAEGAALIADLAHPAVKLMFDCYHVGRSGADVVAELERGMPIIGHVQIASVPDRAEPDRGNLDYRSVFAALDRLDYGGWVGCEYRPAADTDAGLGWTRRLGVSL